MAEGAALTVLATEADWGAVHQQAAEGERFAHAPVDTAVSLQCLQLGVELSNDFFVGVEAFGKLH